MAHIYKNPKVEMAFNYIIDTFGGAENGRFYQFMLFIREMDKRAAEGDNAAEKLLEILFQFQRMIQVIQKPKEN